MRKQKRGLRGRMAQFGFLMKIMVPLIALAIPVAGWVLYEISVLFELPQPAIIQKFLWRHSMPPLTLMLFLLFGLLMALPVSIGAIALDYYRGKLSFKPVDLVVLFMTAGLPAAYIIDLMSTPSSRCLHRLHSPHCPSHALEDLLLFWLVLIFIAIAAVFIARRFLDKRGGV